MGWKKIKNKLLYQLIYDSKLSRWLQILALLEVKDLMCSSDIAESLSITSRTVFMDIKELNQIFEGSMCIIGNDQGFVLTLENLQEYFQKKQQLIANESTLLFLDGIFHKESKSLKEWAETLHMSLSTFKRAEKQLRNVLMTYDLKLSKKQSVKLVGEEIAIRQFYYTLYYEQDFLPPKLVQRKRMNEQHGNRECLPDSWSFNGEKSLGWQMVSWQRQQLGYFLEANEDMAKEQANHLVRKIDPKGEASLNSVELATLFLFSVDETIFVDQQNQRRFIRAFCPDKVFVSFEKNCKDIPLEEKEQLLFLVTWVYLFDCFGLLPQVCEEAFDKQIKELQFIKDEQVMEKLFIDGGKHQVKLLFSNRGYYYFIYMLKKWREKNQYLPFEVLVSWHLTGPYVLQKWVKENLFAEGKKQGILFVEENEALFYASYLPKIQVTNSDLYHNNELCTIQFCEFPTQDDIQSACQKLNVYLKNMHQAKRQLNKKEQVNFS